MCCVERKETKTLIFSINKSQFKSLTHPYYQCHWEKYIFTIHTSKAKFCHFSNVLTEAKMCIFIWTCQRIPWKSLSNANLTLVRSQFPKKTISLTLYYTVYEKKALEVFRTVHTIQILRNGEYLQIYHSFLVSMDLLCPVNLI